MIQIFSTTASKFSLVFALTAFTFAILLGSSANGDEFDRIDRHAQKIQKKSKLLLKETVHYRHTPQYRLLVDATSHLYDAAAHVHRVAHFANNLDHLQSDLAELDRYFDQLEGLFEATEDLASRGRGKVYGNVAYAKGLLRSIEVSIDSMRRDVRKIQSKLVSKHQEVRLASVPVSRSSHAAYTYGNSHRHNQAIAKPRVRKPVVVPPPVVVPRFRPVVYPQRRASGISLSIGGGSSRLHFNF